MRKSGLISGVAVLSIIISGIFTIDVHAAPAPYTGGASVAKVIYPADGSTVTITSTGAVIKQSPGGNPYREGWVNPSDICHISVSSDLNGRLRAGSSNPYSTSASGNTTSSCTSSQPSSNNSSTQTQQPAQQPAATVNNTNTNTANASIVLAGSGQSAKTSQSSTGQTSTASSAPAKSQNNSSVQSLPNTGPGNVFALGGISAVLGSLGHFFIKRRRYS